MRPYIRAKSKSSHGRKETWAWQVHEVMVGWKNGKRPLRMESSKKTLRGETLWVRGTKDSRGATHYALLPLSEPRVGRSQDVTMRTLVTRHLILWEVHNEPKSMICLRLERHPKIIF